MRSEARPRKDRRELEHSNSGERGRSGSYDFLWRAWGHGCTPPGKKSVVAFRCLDAQRGLADLGKGDVVDRRLAEPGANIAEVALQRQGLRLPGGSDHSQGEVGNPDRVVRRRELGGGDLPGDLVA